MSQNTHKDIPDGYTEDEMGLLRDPENMGDQIWSGDNAMPMGRRTQTAPIPKPMDSEPEPKSPIFRRIVIAVIVVIVLLAAVGGVCGVMVAQSAGKVKQQASEVQSQASLLKDAFLEGNEDQLRSTSQSIKSGIKEMQKEVSGPAWSVASFLPVVGTDVRNARSLISSASTLSENALTPLVDGLSGIKFSTLMQDGRIDLNVIKKMRDAVVTAAPVIVEESNSISNLPTGSIAQVNEIILKLKEPLGEASTLLGDADGLFTAILHILGDEGQLRNYVLIAQTNSEVRSGGGFPGSIGTLKVQDGVLTLSDFVSVYGLKDTTTAKGIAASITEEERAAFDDFFSTDAAAITYTPNFMRSGETMRDFWQGAYGEQVNGVIGLDPVFLQRLLKITGGFVADDGTEINGDNVASELLSNVYWRYGDSHDDGNGGDEDTFFNDVAHKSAEKILSGMGGVDFNAFFDAVKLSGEDHRLQVWMADSSEQEIMQMIGVDCKLGDDVTKPELGLYANDNTWSKISWYLNIWADIDDGTKNADGTTTYNVTAHFKNDLTSEEAAQAPIYVIGNNPDKRSKGDMVDTIYIVAPAGASIANYEVHMDYPVPSEIELMPDAQVPIYGHDTWRSEIHVDAQGDTTVTFQLTVPAEATQKPTVRTSPSCKG